MPRAKQRDSWKHAGCLYNESRTLTLPRPAFLVAEPEPEQALSTRKLLLETFKFNVITAHSERETVDLLHLFPDINALHPRRLWDRDSTRKMLYG